MDKYIQRGFMIKFDDCEILEEIETCDMRLYPSQVNPIYSENMFEILSVLRTPRLQGRQNLPTTRSFIDFCEAAYLWDHSKTIAFCILARSARMGNIFSRHNLKVRRHQFLCLLK